MHKNSALLIHSSNELYGADRIFLQVLTTAKESFGGPVKVWLPDDVPSDGPLSALIASQSIRVESAPLPILRRAYFKPRKIAGLLRKVAQTMREMRVERPAVVYLSTSACAVVAPIARLFGARVVLHVQEGWRRPESVLLGVLATSSTEIVCISDWVFKQLPSRLKQRARVIRNAIPDDPKPCEWRQGTQSKPIFLMSSRWNGWKGHRTLLEAWDASGAPGELWIAGGPPPSGEAVDVVELVKSCAHPSSIRVIGETNTIADLIDSSDVVMVPSDAPEPFGLVAIEAFRRGRPVIASQDGGVGDIVRDGATGFTFKNRSATDLAHAIKRAVASDLASMGHAARIEFEENYVDSVYVHDFCDLWQRLQERT